VTRLAVFLFVLAAAAGGIALAAAPAGLRHARHFHRYRLLYAGQRLDGQPLDVVIERQATRRHPPNWSFVYGDCTPDPSEDEASCTAPYEIQDWPICERNPARYDPEARGRRIGRVRGAPVYLHDADGTWLELYTGHTAVAIWGPSVRADRDALRALRSIGGQVSPRDRLPRPARGALAGHVHCR
jgi:hypothetical protein